MGQPPRGAALAALREPWPLALLAGWLATLLATLPIYTSILASFNHHLLSHAQAIRFTRGLALGLFGFIAFFAVIVALLTRAPLWAAFAAATLAALATQAALGWLTRDCDGHALMGRAHTRARGPLPPTSDRLTATR